MQSITPDIYTSDADGSDLTNLTKSPEIEEFDPNYSPNGLQMCFTRGDFKTGWGIYIANSDGSNPTRLVGDEPPESLYSYCDWSPDGTKLAYAYHPESRGAEYDDDVYVMKADGSGKINLTKSSKESDGCPSWSSDGTKIIFSSYRNGDGGTLDADGGIYTMDADGSDVARVTKVTKNSGYVDGCADWQPLTPESRSMTVDPPDTGGPSLLLVASALLFSGGVMFYAGLKRRV